MEGWIAAIIRRPVTTAMVTITLLLFGVVAVLRMPVELLPNLSYPSITVQTDYADAAPSEVEELVTRPIEELVGAVPGVVSVESISREGRSEVVLDFAWGTRIDDAMANVREKLDRVELPLDVERPVVLRYDPSQEPIVRLALVAEHGSDGRPLLDSSRLRLLAEKQIERALEKVDGVAAVDLHGGDQDEVRIELDPRKLDAYGVPAQTVVDALRADNVNRPGGGITERDARYLVRTVHEARTPEQLCDVVVVNAAPDSAQTADGSRKLLHVRDVATCKRVPIEREELTYVNGREAIEVAIFREGDANTVAVASAVLAFVERRRADPAFRLEVLSNQARFIEDAVQEVVSNVVVGGVLAVLVLLFFLRDLRATMVIAAAIPVSLLTTFVPLRSLEVSLNLMSLGGLALGVGMLVDNSIVVLEAIARRRELDPNAGAAVNAARGTGEVAASVVASTLTTVAVFLPLTFIEGVAGQLVRDLAWAVSWSILSSMFVSLSVVPVLQSMGDVAPPPPERTVALGWLAAIPAALFRVVGMIVWVLAVVLGTLSAPLHKAWLGLERVYPPILSGILRVRSVVVLGALGLCVATVPLARGLPSTLIPEVSQGEFFVQIQLPQGTALERTAAVVQRLAAALEGDERVAISFARVGSVTQSGSASGGQTATHVAQIDVRLAEGITDPEAAEAELFARLRAAAGEELELRLGRPALVAFESPLEIQLFSDDLERSRNAAIEAVARLTEVDGLADVVPDDLAGRPELRVDFDRDRLARLGLDVDAASLALQRAIQGELAGTMHTADDQLDVRVQLPRVDRTSRDDVGDVVVAVTNGVPVRIRAVASLVPATGPAEIRRIDGQRGIRIRARTTDTDLGRVSTQVEDVVAAIEETHTVQGVVAGQAREMSGSLASLAFTTALSLFLVYVVMASTFESLHHPLLIMFSVPFAGVGLVLGLVVTGLPISAIGGMGAIILGGIVVNNAIVLIDAINQRRDLGLGVGDAIVAAAGTRLRPILMTTATTVLGLLPMSLGLGDGAALRQPLAVTVIGGLLMSTLLTLVVIPCIYALFPGRNAGPSSPDASRDQGAQSPPSDEPSIPSGT